MLINYDVVISIVLIMRLNNKTFMSSFQTFPLSWCYFSIRLLLWSRWCQQTHHCHSYAVGVVAIPFHTGFTKKRQTGNEKDTEKDRERQSKERQREIKFGCRKKWRLTKVQQSVRQTERNSAAGEAKRQKNKAGYTATPVACGLAGAIFEVTWSLGQEQWGQGPQKTKKEQCDGQTDRQTDGPTDGQSGV